MLIVTDTIIKYIPNNNKHRAYGRGRSFYYICSTTVLINKGINYYTSSA